MVEDNLNLEAEDDDEDIKPIIIIPTASAEFNSQTQTEISEVDGLSQSLPSSPKKWSPELQDGNRKSAFQPYKQKNPPICTILTNLQRGNTQAETPLPDFVEFNFFSKAGQGEITEQDIKNERDVNVCDENGLSALHWAASHGQFNTVQLLLQNGAEVDLEGPDGETPLILAAVNGYHEVIRLLIVAKAKINHEDHMCNTPLMFAAKGNHPHSCQELLLNGAKLEISNLNEETAYNIAESNNSHLALAVMQKFLISQFGI